MSCLPCHEENKWRSRIFEDEVRAEFRTETER